MDFLDWLEEIGEGKEVVLVSHGSEDILVLDRNLARYDLQTRLYSLISHLVDFQEYLTNHFTDMKGRAGLDMLVNCYLKGSQYRLHCPMMTLVRWKLSAGLYIACVELQ